MPVHMTMCIDDAGRTWFSTVVRWSEFPLRSMKLALSYTENFNSFGCEELVEEYSRTRAHCVYSNGYDRIIGEVDAFTDNQGVHLRAWNVQRSKAYHYVRDFAEFILGEDL